MNIPGAIVLGAALISASIALSHRYEMVRFDTKDGTPPGVWRSDNWTGDMMFCDKSVTGEGCEPVKIYEKAAP